MATRIIVTGANGQVGKALLARLWDTSAETHAVTRIPGPLQATKVVASPLDSEKVQKAIRQSDVAIHLAGTRWPKTSNSYYGANVATTAALINAMRDSNVKRIIFLSSVDAREDSPNEYLRTKGQAEALLRTTGIPTVVFRCTHLIGSPDSPGATAQALQSVDGERFWRRGYGLPRSGCPGGGMGVCRLPEPVPPRAPAACSKFANAPNERLLN